MTYKLTWEDRKEQKWEELFEKALELESTDPESDADDQFKDWLDAIQD